MKKISLVFSMLALIFSSAFSQETLSPYFKVAELKGESKEVIEQVSKVIEDGGFTIIGEYHPAESNKLTVICFTNNELKNLSLQFKDRGALASVLKAAIVEKDGKKTLSILNPEYMFLAYWGEQLKGQNEELKKMSERVKNLFSAFGTLQPFGGEVAAKDLPDYHYMMMMPYFDEPVELAEFDSFEKGLETIRKNLAAKKGNTVKVYEQLFANEKIAVFGLGLTNKEEGEAYFLPVIGEDNIANLPYEIILQGKTATILHGKYRIAIYWPELKMGTFMKISSTPGYIEDVMEGLTE
ncbi:MAG TPA: hypothetical protein VIN10_06850 [Bacteroidales bacterium]